MLESLLPETKDILERAAKIAGREIEICSTEEGYLSSSNISSSYLANPDENLVIAYSPLSKNRDYAIAHEAARIIRHARAPPGKRYALVSEGRHREKAFRQLSKDLEKVKEGYRTYSGALLAVLYNGLLTQLVSTPADFWINKWLVENYPSFQAEVKSGMDEIFHKAHLSLGDDLAAMAPATIYKATNSMNASFAQFVDGLLGNSKYFQPYRGTELERTGSALRELNSKDRGHRGDKLATDRWAKELGLREWYTWKKA